MTEEERLIRVALERVFIKAGEDWAKRYHDATDDVERRYIRGQIKMIEYLECELRTMINALL